MEYEKMTKAELIKALSEAEFKLAEQKHIAEAIEAKDKTINLYAKELEEIKSTKKNYETQEKNVTILVEENKRLVEIANQYINVFRNLLKGLQGQLDNAIELEALINPSVKK